MSNEARPTAASLNATSGTSRAIRKALNVPLLIDHAADASFTAMIHRLRSEPGSSNRKQS